MLVKPVNSKGTRDFLPEEVRKRAYITGILRTIFRRYGFQEIETPAMERLETLTGKYGSEGDQVLFKILNSGDFLRSVDPEKLTLRDSRQILPQITEKGLRYDLTVPLARYVVQHQHQLVFPFRRFHIGPVWRADRPQKGRYQEFYQCDADCVGSSSLMNEVELSSLLADAFDALKIPVTIRISHRGLLEAIAEFLGCSDKLIEMTTLIDKIDKVGLDGIREEFVKKEWESSRIDQLLHILACNDLDALPQALLSLNSGKKALDDLRFVMNRAALPNLHFDITLARGLNYYTGVIWEVVEHQVNIGSIGSGGRYDELTALFGGRNLTGVGISFGLERIFDVMEQLQLFPSSVQQSTRILFVHFHEAARDYAYAWVKELRKRGIEAELYPDSAKIQKQFSYAHDRHIPFVAVVGDDEMRSQMIKLKDMQQGTQKLVSLDELMKLL